jgi:hypothetical protein
LWFEWQRKTRLVAIGASLVRCPIWATNLPGAPGIIISKYADFDALRLTMDGAGNPYAIGADKRPYRVQAGAVFPIDGLANVVALAAGTGNTLLIAEQRLDEDPLHADSEIREVTVQAGD